MAYEHGVKVIEKRATKERPAGTDSAVQVVIGTAPIHLTENPMEAVNKPIIAYKWDDAAEKIGYSTDFDSYTLCESIFASFELEKVAPVVFINVLNPDVHKKTGTKELTISKGVATLAEDGVLLSTLKLKSADGGKELVNKKDYTANFNEDGQVLITAISSDFAAIGTVTVEFNQLDPEMVSTKDIIGGYDAETGLYSGAELIRQIHPRFGIVPNIILAPGWSHKPEVAAVLDAKCQKINGNFNAYSCLDIDSSVVTRPQDVKKWKDDNHYSFLRGSVLWPKVKVGDKILWYSSLKAAAMASLDMANENVPYRSSSNKKIPISATVLPDGSEIYLDQVQANALNEIGVMTALNWNGWRTWGNFTSMYPDVTDPQDKFEALRRVFDWWGNSFIKTFFNDVDDPTDYYLIESIVDRENVRANAFKAKGQIAGASIEFRRDMNPEEDILNGKIVFIQKIGAFSPTESITNILEFDPTIVLNAFNGGGQ